MEQMVWNTFAILRIVSASYFKKVVRAVSKGNKKIYLVFYLSGKCMWEVLPLKFA